MGGSALGALSKPGVNGVEAVALVSEWATELSGRLLGEHATMRQARGEGGGK